jgi:hypothetical protein
MMYQAKRRKDGTPSVGEPDDSTCGGQPGSAETFNRTCQILAHSESEERALLEKGWRNHPSEAMARFESKEKAAADTAAHRHYEDRNMSDAAKAEAAAVDAQTEEHVPAIPEAKRGPGRPRKTVAA